mgnify:CR=1 FL=1
MRILGPIPIVFKHRQVSSARLPPRLWASEKRLDFALAASHVSDTEAITISHNTWIHRIARATVVRPLIKSSVTPNQLTTMRLLVGTVAAVALGVGVSPWQHIGAAFFVVSMILDRADGDLARITDRTSPGGHKYDLIADSLSNALIFVGLGVGLRGGEFGMIAVPMGLAAGAAVAAVLWLVMRIEELDGARAAELSGAAGFDPDDAMLALPVAVWSGWSEPLLVAATIGAPAFALFFFWFFRRKLLLADTD